MSCTDKNVLRRRRIVAAALALPLSLGFTGTAMATAAGDPPRAAAAEQSAPQADAALRVADAGKAAPAAVETKALPEQASEKAAENAALKQAAAPVDAPGSAAGAASGQAAATTTGGSYVNGNANSSKDERPTALVPGTPSQPVSNADKNGNGANPGVTCTHAYCSNGTGLPTGNGVGDGKAVGQPCAGCVGKADNKNPKGQAPNGTDHNAGYECDRNQGIGQTNPAHTGCVPGGTTTFDECPNITGDQPAGTDCGGGSFDECPNITGDQPAGTDCGGGGGGGGSFDNCPDMDGNQPAGTSCGGGGSFDNCPDMPGNQPANTVCSLGSPNPPVTGVTPPQPATNPVPVGPPTKVPPKVVPNAANPPAVIGGPVTLPATRAVQARPVPSALPFTGTDAALLAELGLLLLVGGAGIAVVARRESTARAA